MTEEQRKYFETNVLIKKEIKDAMQNILDNKDVFGDIDEEMVQNEIDSCNNWLEHYDELMNG